MTRRPADQATRFTVIGAALLVAASSRVPIHAQDQRPSPTFRSTVQYVEVDARVVDARGNPVLGLRKEDFHLREDGVEQTIDTFTAVDLPVETHTATPMTANGTLFGPDVTTNTDQATLRGRLYVLMLDDRQTAAANSATVIRIAKRFIERSVGPQDLVAIVTTTGRSDIGQSFTSNKPVLLGAIGRFMGHKLDPIELDPLPGNVNIRKTEQFQASRMALEGLASVCDWLGGITGITKSLVLISEGVDYDTETDFIRDAWATELLHEQRNAIAAATRANVTIYPVDPRGLGSDDSIAMNNMEPEIHKALQRGIERAHANLREIAVDTGGVEALNTNQFEKALDRIVTHGSRYYLLGYHPANTRRDGKFRTIKVTVDRPGAQVLARRGYGEGDQTPNDVAPVQLFAERDPLPRTVRETLNNPLPLHEMTLSITAAAYRGTGSNASLAIVVESPALTFVPVDGKSTGTVDIVTAAIDDQNTVVTGQSNQISFKLAGPNPVRGEQRRFRTMTRLNDLAPGRYELRVAATDREAGRRGSVWYAVEVPDFAKGPLTMSGLLVSSLGESRTLTANPTRPSPTSCRRRRRPPENSWPVTN